MELTVSKLTCYNPLKEDLFTYHTTSSNNRKIKEKWKV